MRIIYTRYDTKEISKETSIGLHMPRAKPVRDNDDLEELDVLTYPGPDDFIVPIDDLRKAFVVLYGQKAKGKTSTVAGIPKSLTLELEPLREGLPIRQLSLKKYTAQQIMDGAKDTYQLIVNTTQTWIDDPTIDGLNFDSVDIFYECCYHSVCARNHVTEPGKAKDSVGVWNELRDEFAGYFDTLKESRLGIWVTSHVKERDEKDLEGSKMSFNAPSCAPACLKYLRQAADVVLQIGSYSGKRAIMVRDDTNSSFVACGIRGRFRQPDGKQVKIFEIPNDEENPHRVYETIVRAFNNEEWDIDTPEDKRDISTPKPKPGPPKKGPPRR